MNNIRKNTIWVINGMELRLKVQWRGEIGKELWQWYMRSWWSGKMNIFWYGLVEIVTPVIAMIATAIKKQRNAVYSIVCSNWGHCAPFRRLDTIKTGNTCKFEAYSCTHIHAMFLSKRKSAKYCWAFFKLSDPISRNDPPSASYNADDHCVQDRVSSRVICTICPLCWNA